MPTINERKKVRKSFIGDIKCIKAEKTTPTHRRKLQGEQTFFARSLSGFRFRVSCIVTSRCESGAVVAESFLAFYTRC